MNCQISQECDGSCKGYNPTTHVCNVIVHKTATPAEEFGPEHAKHVAISNLNRAIDALRESAKQAGVTIEIKINDEFLPE